MYKALNIFWIRILKSNLYKYKQDDNYSFCNLITYDWSVNIFTLLMFHRPLNKFISYCHDQYKGYWIFS